ncbi:MAG TPA: GNAT family protein [Tepidiformaceae bacterium]|nr:GNAT family protein [Tepidiformaceae bacterium]
MAIRDHHHTDVAERVVLRDGTVMLIRRMCDEDRPRLERLADRCSPETLRLRFFTPTRHPTAEQLARLVDLDFIRNAAYVATLEGDEEIRAIGRLGAESHTVGEVAFIVEDAYQGHGIATELLHHLVAFGRERGYVQFVALMLAENRAMHEVFEHAGYPIRTTWDAGLVRVTVDIRPQPGTP